MTHLHASQIELSKSALQTNLRFLNRRVGDRARVCHVVKGNAYGHGIEAFVPLAESCGVRLFAVANADEAVRVFNSRTADSEIIIMSFVGAEAMEWAVRNRVQFFVFDLVRLEAAIRCAEKTRTPARIHMELETGFHRVGLEASQLDKAVDLIQKNLHLVTVEGLCTHYAGAESVANYVRIQQQLTRFSELSTQLDGPGFHEALRHTASSAAALTYPDTVMDMVRIGIATYGFWPTKETQMQYYLGEGGLPDKRPRDPLRRILRWTSRIMSVKTVEPGSFVGYGTRYLTTRRERIAAIPVGYADGYSRSLDSHGHVLVHGRRAPVVGHVNMSVLLINVTEVSGAAPGDEVVLIGSQGKRSITVTSFSDMTRNLNYEVLVRLPADIPRLIVD